MKMIPVNSTAISAIGYEPMTKTMNVKFRNNNRIYTFCGVPSFIFDDFISANSKGQYYDQHIRDRYRC
ncbi:KTSC domain-containing protein [Cyanobacterium aponinum 0216]|uniref:KTSC domain-containing protein n=2 Tax=Cyanobacterium TaxID=102234 RepID=A0A844GRA5_9CHRO|nr:KTSC domain-containing protein [Cyanobacterium aponinum 0216]